MDLPLEPKLSIGLQYVLAPTGYDDREGSAASDLPEVVRLLDALGFDSIWSGDHVAFAGPILDPLVQIAQAAALSDRLTDWDRRLPAAAPPSRAGGEAGRDPRHDLEWPRDLRRRRRRRVPTRIRAVRRAGGGARRPAQRRDPRAPQALVGRGRGPCRPLLSVPRGRNSAAAGATGRSADLVRRPRRCLRSAAQAGSPTAGCPMSSTLSATAARSRPLPPQRPTPDALWSASARRTCCSCGSTRTARARSRSRPSS